MPCAPAAAACSRAGAHTCLALQGLGGGKEAWSVGVHEACVDALRTGSHGLQQGSDLLCCAQEGHITRKRRTRVAG
eukprot:358717-Chlamydomonas_euryale.AAC.2